LIRPKFIRDVEIEKCLYLRAKGVVLSDMQFKQTNKQWSFSGKNNDPAFYLKKPMIQPDEAAN
jgi:hypothetical protein